MMKFLWIEVIYEICIVIEKIGWFMIINCVGSRVVVGSSWFF